MNFIDFWSLSMYAGRQCRAGRKMFYGNMVKTLSRLAMQILFRGLKDTFGRMTDV
jgi:hypothetical protein